MENASKALIIAAEVLLGVLLLTLMVFAFRNMTTFSDVVDRNLEASRRNEFNTRFENYRKKDNLTAQDVISIANLAKECAQNNQPVDVKIEGVQSKFQKGQELSQAQTYEFIQIYNETIFSCVGENTFSYHPETGRVQKITIKKIN